MIPHAEKPHLRPVHRLIRALMVPLFVLLPAVVFLAACASSRSSTQQRPSDGDVLARYRGGVVTADEFHDRYARSTPGPDADSLDAVRDFLERYVNFKLKVLDARERGMHLDSAIVSEMSTYRSQLARPYLIERLIVDSLARQLYERQKVELNASHILKLVDQFDEPGDTLEAYRAMEALADSIEAGADFNALALRHSDDPSARQNQGRLGYFSGGRLIYPFEDAAYAMPVGGVSPIFRTQFGYHILKVEDRRPHFAQIRAAHILISTRERDSTEALEQIQALRARALAGEDFAELARAHSEDPGSGTRGGDLGFFSRGRMVAPFEQAAFELESPGDISDVVRTQFGYHLIQLLEREEQQSYEAAYEGLKTLVNRLPRFEASQLRLGARLRQAAGSFLDTEVLESLLEAASPADSAFLKLTQQPLPSGQSDRIIAGVGEQRFAVDEFVDFLRSRRLRKPPTSVAHFTRLLNDFVNLKALDEAALTLEDRNPDFRRLMQEYEEGILLFAVSEDSVWSPASSDSAALAQLYAERRGTFVFPERLRVVALQTRVDSVARALHERLSEGASLAALMSDMDLSSLRIDTTFVADTTNSVFDRAFGLDIGGHTEPIRGRTGLTILILDGQEAPREKTFSEARADLVGVYQDLLEQRWVERLRRRYRVEVFPERL